jgi:hypothetical protein
LHPSTIRPAALPLSTRATSRFRRPGRVVRVTTLAMCLGIAPWGIALASAPGSPSVDPSVGSTPGASPSAVVCPTQFPVPILGGWVAPSTSASGAAGMSLGTGSGASPSVAPAESSDPCAAALPQLGLGVGPSRIILDQATRVGSFQVFNGGEAEEAISATPFDFTWDASGNRLPTTDLVPLGAAEWVSMDPSTFVLQPGETQVVGFSISVPADASPGDHYAGIQVLGTLSEAAWATVMPGLHGASVRSQITFPVTVIARVPGRVVPDVVVPPMEASLAGVITTTSGDYTFTPSIINDGNVAAVWAPVAGPAQTLEAIVPTLRLASTSGLFATDALLYDGTHAAKGAVTLSTLVVLPGATHTQRLTMTDAPLYGTYDYTYTLPASLVDGRPVITTTGHFTIVNLRKILLWVVLPLVLLLLMLAGVVLGRRHRRSQRRHAELERRLELDMARREAVAQATSMGKGGMR